VPNSYLNEETKLKIKNSLKGKNKEIFREYNKFKKGKSYEKQMFLIYGEAGKIKANNYKEKISKNTTGENNPMFKKGYKISGEKNGMFGKISPRKGKHNTKEQNEKISKSKQGKKRNTKQCPYCNQKISDGNYERWHGEHCKYKNK
jgi:hypothetical protein